MHFEKKKHLAKEMLTEINHVTRKFPLSPTSFHNVSSGPPLFSVLLLLASVARGKVYLLQVYLRSQVIKNE